VRVRVAGRTEIEPGQRRLVDVNGETVGIFNVGGSFFALVNRCVHQGGPVCNGKIMPRLSAEVLPSGEVKEVLSAEIDTIACPWHGWEYDLRSGQCLANPRLGLQAYQVVSEGDDLFVDTGNKSTGNGSR
jgi:nitrite reductase (NADH) small subunit